MTVVKSETRQRDRLRQIPAQAYARMAGVLFLVSFIAGGFGEAYVPSRIIVGGNAAATMQNFRNYDLLLRLGFTGYLLEASCDIALVMLFYVLLKPVDRYISLLAAMFGLMGTGLFAAAELYFFSPTLLTGGAGFLKSFTPDQLDALALLSLQLFSVGAGLFMTFYGTGWILRGVLIYRSGYLPKFLGVLMAISGAAFVARNLEIVLALSLPAPWFPVLMAPGMLTLTVWLLVKGLDERKWLALVAGSQSKN